MSKGDSCLSTAGFYGQKNKRKWIGLENSINSVVKKHQTEKIPKSFPFRILGPITTWQTFFRQQEAFQFCKSTSKDLHVFAFESGSFEGNTGQRLYLSASYPVFWHYYRQLEEQKRLHYEVIPEGAVCKLYFDLEYDRSLNPNSDGNLMVDVFIKLVCQALESTFKVRCTRKDVLDLDASTEKKFSRHLIYQIRNAAFKDNIHAGRFVCSIMSKLLMKIQSSKTETGDSIAENTTGTASQPEIEHRNNVDLETKQDGFRENGHNAVNLHEIDSKSLTDCDSTSLNGSETLNSPSVMNTEENAVGEKEKSLEKDMDNFVSGTKFRQGDIIDDLEKIFTLFASEDLQKLMVKNKNGDDILFCDTGVYTKNRNFRLFLSSKLGKKNPLLVSEQNEYCSLGETEESKVENIFYDSLVANVEYSSSMKILSFEGDDMSSHMTGLSGRRKDKTSQETECINGYSKSPYPEVDDYIVSIITMNAWKGVIRHWTYFHQGELLVYEIAKYRYCHNIGRHHRSNNIMLIADLQKGVWYQKCHDPDCHLQNYKSPEWPLPKDILPASYFDDDLDLDNEMDDDELLNTTVELEKQYMDQQAPKAGKSELDDGDDDDLLAAVAEEYDSHNPENG